MKYKYLVRLDDACPTMNREKWGRVEVILDRFNIKPMVGIIPNNKDPQLEIDEFDSNFWTKAKQWQDKSWTIALHGYDHVYLTTDGGIHPLNNASEFAGISYDKQRDKIEKGYNILVKHGMNVEWFFAPSHSFDLNTIKALKEVTPISKISDGFSFMPYNQHGITFYPNQMGHFRKIKIKGVWTFCFHPNTMNEQSFIDFENFIIKNRNAFVGFDNASIRVYSSKRTIDKIGNKAFFVARSLKRIIAK